MSEKMIPFLPLALLALSAACGVLMKTLCKFSRVENPLWPYAENPQLALELAGSLERVDAVLGGARTKIGDCNRKAAVRFQGLDLVFIPIYVLFFIAVAFMRGGWALGWIAIVPALLTGVLDILEDWQILRMLRGTKGSSARAFGQLKWLFYFLTLVAEGSLFFFVSKWDVLAVAGILLGVFLIAIAAGGVIAVLRNGFIGIMSAANLSTLGLLLLALAPLASASWGVAAEYAVLMRVPLIIGTTLFLLPLIAFFTGARTLLRGLFELTPLSLFAATLASLAVAGTACQTAYTVLHNATARFQVGNLPFELPALSVWLVILFFLGLPVIAFSLYLSIKENGNAGTFVLAAIGGIVLALGAAYVLGRFGPDLVGFIIPSLPDLAPETYLGKTDVLTGYVGRDHLPGHLGALAGFAATAFFYTVLGAYGLWKLGKRRTVPALCSLLMLILMLCWILSGVAFFFDHWHIPILLIVALAGALTAQSRRSDHFYDLLARENYNSATPTDTILAANRRRVIVVAANGGGIQAGAWAAQVLYGLSQFCGPDFEESLRLISSVSGGSVGNACFVHWLANGKTGRLPNEAAAESSLDEVAWGMVWPDFLRSLIPWVLRHLIGRGRALEKAWRNNSVCEPSSAPCLDAPLSSWNQKVADGTIPAVIMNATIAETGERLLFGTTHLTSAPKRGARLDSTKLLTINGEYKDVAIATAARLSASFPYVTPAARADAVGPQPHVVDGGYYDNYGMATLVEWLDEALEGAKGSIESVLVIQIVGAPPDPDPSEKRLAKQRGWFYQAFAPLQTLAEVRTAGQSAHNDIELKFLQQKWDQKGVSIPSVTFEFDNPNPPLSWHLTPQEQQKIKDVWNNRKMDADRQTVKNFF